MKASDYIAKVLYDNGIDTVFGHLGGFNADIVDSIYGLGKIAYVMNYHEQASSFAANAYALIQGGTAVAMSSGAPSSCNLIAGIANAYFDSIPCVFIVGSVHSKAVRTSKNIRQNAFEEIDMVRLTSDITKLGMRVTNPQDIRYYLEKAFHTAAQGRPGPVLIDIPYDIARADIDPETLKAHNTPQDERYDEINTEKIMHMLKAAHKPLILLGGGAKSKKCRREITALLNKVEIPVVASLLGLDVLSHNHKCFAGFIGHYGNRYANFAVANCDLLIVIGSRLDERQLAGLKDGFAPDAKIIRVDIDGNELGNKNWNTPDISMSIRASAEKFLTELLMQNFSGLDYSRWLSLISAWQKSYPSLNSNPAEVNANDFLRTISDYISDDAIVCADVGQNQMCTAQSMRLDNNRRLLNTGGYGSMGFSLPAAIGAAYAFKDTEILSISGDGGIQMNIQELQTIVRDNLPVNIILLNNNCLGMIRRLQEKMFNNRTFASVQGYSIPDFSKIATAYGIEYLKIDCPEKYALARNFISSTSPRFVELVLPREIQNIPEPGASISTQIPLLSDEEFERIKKEAAL